MTGRIVTFLLDRQPAARNATLDLWLSVLIQVCLAPLCCRGADSSVRKLSSEASFNQQSRWWPTQAMPKRFVRTGNRNEFPAPHAAIEMMVQSMAGLAAKAVNDGRGDELVWV